MPVTKRVYGLDKESFAANARLIDAYGQSLMCGDGDAVHRLRARMGDLARDYAAAMAEIDLGTWSDMCAQCGERSSAYSSLGKIAWAPGELTSILGELRRICPAHLGVRRLIALSGLADTKTHGFIILATEGAL